MGWVDGEIKEEKDGLRYAWRVETGSRYGQNETTDKIQTSYEQCQLFQTTKKDETVRGYGKYTVNRKKHTKKFFLIYSLQSLTDCDKIWYILSWVNLPYRNVNVFRLTWIVSLLYLVKLSIRVLQVNSS